MEKMRPVFGEFELPCDAICVPDLAESVSLFSQSSKSCIWCVSAELIQMHSPFLCADRTLALITSHPLPLSCNL